MPSFTCACHLICAGNLEQQKCNKINESVSPDFSLVRKDVLYSTKWNLFCSPLANLKVRNEVKLSAEEGLGLLEGNSFSPKII